PDIQIEVRSTRLTSENALKLTEGYDIIADCTDNFATRYLINDVCVLTNRPMVSGAVYKTQGIVGVFNFKNGPSFRCIHPEFIEDNKLNDASNVGILSIIPGTIGTLQAIEIIKMAIGFGEILSGKLLLMDVTTHMNYLVNVTKNSENFTLTNLQSNY
ncbi:MAG TPA: dinucleotide-utilizing protein, partial [Bacteroidales bacterium]|nr:dinucleotide-utilizing protein [Bacteroidales bacterium]